MGQPVESGRLARADWVTNRSVMGNKRFGLAGFTGKPVGGGGHCLSGAGVRLAAVEPVTCDAVFAASQLLERPIGVRCRERDIRTGIRTNATTRSDTVNAPFVEASSRPDRVHNCANGAVALERQKRRFVRQLRRNRLEKRTETERPELHPYLCNQREPANCRVANRLSPSDTTSVSLSRDSFDRSDESHYSQKSVHAY